jgi:hypothetical protein
VEDFQIGRPSGYRASLEQEELLARLRTEDGAMPFVLAGRVSRPGGSDEEPPELLLAVNGTPAGLVGSYRPAGNAWEFARYVADFYREGANVVELYEIDRESAHPTLHPVRRNP